VKTIEILIESEIDKTKLDLSGLCVFTEAATGNYVVTSLIAAKAGAKVIAITNNSRYGSISQVMEETKHFADQLNVSNNIEIVRTRDRINEADIVTNLGWVRPIDADLISKMKRDAVIALMYEKWEVRPGDVDILEASRQGIRVVENIEGPIFEYCGELAVKLIHERGITIHGSYILLVGDDKFGDVIARQLHVMGATVYRNVPNIRQPDCIIIADIKRKDIIDTITLPQTDIIVIAGATENEGKPGVMNHTFAYLGPRPVIELHTKGLMVASRRLQK